MPRPWTSKLLIKSLGVAKCNGSMEAATENLSLEQAIEVAKQDNLSSLCAQMVRKFECILQMRNVSN